MKTQKTMTKITKHFSLNEFTDSETAQRLNIDNSLPFNGEDLNIKNLVINLLEPLRGKFGVMKINSGYRCKALNKAVGGVETSHHRKGQAADINFLETPEKDVFEYLKNNPDNLKWTQAIYYPSKGFLHLSYINGNLKNQIFTK